MQPDRSLEERYQVGSGEVSISVVIGNAQFGVIDVRFAGESQPLARQSNTVLVPLGPGDGLVGRDLVVRTLATDVNPFTNRLIVTHVLSGGPENEIFPMQHEVSEDGEVVYFRALFHFVA